MENRRIMLYRRNFKKGYPEQQSKVNKHDVSLVLKKCAKHFNDWCENCENSQNWNCCHYAWLSCQFGYRIGHPNISPTLIIDPMVN